MKLKLIIFSIAIFSKGTVLSQLYTQGLGVTDVDGNSYSTIVINGQEWMAENLKTSKYSNGDVIPNTQNGLDWVHLTSGSWVWYNNDPTNEIPYGKLYNFYTVEDSRGLCPNGWRVPSQSDFDVLIGSIGGYTGTSMKLKVTDNNYWTYTSIFGGTINNNGTNASGFSGYPSGFRYGMSSQPNSPDNGPFSSLGTYLNLWTTTPALNSQVMDWSGNGLVWVLNIRSLTDDLVIYEDQKESGNAVRCMREAINPISCDLGLVISSDTTHQNIGSGVLLSSSSTSINSTIQWQSDFGQGYVNLNDFGHYSGTNTNNLSISNVQLSNHNQPFRVIAISGNCVDTSNISVLSISNICTSNVTIYDTVSTNEIIYDTLTTNITIYDTITTSITIYDTLTTNIYDTTYITVYDTLLTTVTDTLIINTTLSLPSPNNQNTILIYPNPASDHITIDNGNFAAMEGYNIKITNNAGQEVFQSAINQAQFYVDLSTWTGNGLYFVHLIDSQNNTVTVRKILLQ